jgi:hypothetical protein
METTNVLVGSVANMIYSLFFITNSPQGDGNQELAEVSISHTVVFHNQFPARGWKREAIMMYKPTTFGFS